MMMMITTTMTTTTTTTTTTMMMMMMMMMTTTTMTTLLLLLLLLTVQCNSLFVSFQFNVRGQTPLTAGRGGLWNTASSTPTFLTTVPICAASVPLSPRTLQVEMIMMIFV
jgi:hypothetical protein